MVNQGRSNTRDRILTVAAKLFSEKGYDRVTTRELATEIGINAASMYYYFSSKEDILKSLYTLYSHHLKEETPDLEELLILAEIDEPHKVLMKTEFHFDENVREMLDQIVVIATGMLHADEDSKNFIYENIFKPTDKIVKPLLKRMVELGKIKPFDIDTFIEVFSYYCFSAAALNRSSFRLDVEGYQGAMSFLFSMVTPLT